MPVSWPTSVHSVGSRVDVPQRPSRVLRIGPTEHLAPDEFFRGGMIAADADQSSALDRIGRELGFELHLRAIGVGALNLRIEREGGHRDEGDRTRREGEPISAKLAPERVPRRVGRGSNRLARQIALEIGSETGGRWIPSLFFLRHGTRGDDLDVTFERRIDGTEARRFILDDAAGQLGQRRITLAVRQSTREQTKEDDSERVHVGARVDCAWYGAYLLGTHVGDCAEQLTGFGRERRGHVDPARDAKIQDLWLTVLADENVAWLQIAMNHAPLMRVLDGGSDAGEQLHAIPYR
jgi:hypothetical protein